MPSRAILALIVLLAALAGCSCQPRPAISPLAPSTAAAPAVRVRLMAATSRAKLEATEAVRAANLTTNEAVELRLPAAAVYVSLDAAGWTIGDQKLPRGELLLEPGRVGSLRVEGVPYRGLIRLVPSDADHFDVINDVDVDAYLKGVLAAEMLPNWHMTAFKAQAVVARTYALYEASTRTDRGHWELFADDRSQVYGGIPAETALSTAAVDATRGLVLAYGPPGQEKIFKAYFHSVTGGSSLSARDAFGDVAIPPLGSRSTGEWGKSSSRYTWKPFSIEKAELTRRVRAWGRSRNRPEADIGPIDKLEVVTRDEFGRPVRFELTDTRRQRFSLGPEETRWAINYDRGRQTELYSSYFTPRVSGNAIVIEEGRGFGHGVGLGQYAAQEQAVAGWPWERIVLEAYPQAVVLRAY